MTNIGLHIGGGPNDSAAKAPIERAIEQHFDVLRGCYRHAPNPERGGIVGVDLYIDRNGGYPIVRDVRTQIRGTTFHDCIVHAFEEVSFTRPPKGPTVISYSLRYTLEDL
jgi:hypothetical protein